MPAVSIITATLNRRALLEQAVNSVREIRQLHPGLTVEHLVADGGSTDDSREWLAEQPDLRFLPGPDAGIYDAWNQAVAASSGEIVGFLNSDDLYCPEAFSQVLAAFSESTDVVTGGAEVFAEEKILRRWPAPEGTGLSARNALLEVPLINARFFRRSVFERVGEFSRHWKIIADCDFMLRCALARVRGVTIPETLCRYRQHGDSLTFDPQNRRALAIHAEYLDWTSSWLEEGGHSPELTDLLRRSHTRRAWAKFARGLLYGQWADSMEAVHQGWRRDPAWPFGVFDYLQSSRS